MILRLLLSAFLSAASAQEKAPSAVLWAPAYSQENPFPAEELLQVIQENPGLRLALALPPEETARISTQTLKALEASFQIEMVLRLKGDPILPLIRNHPSGIFYRPQDVAERILAEKGKYRGFYAGGGALEPGLCPVFKAAALDWVSSAHYPPPWARCGRAAVIAFKAFPSDDLSQESRLIVSGELSALKSLLELDKERQIRRVLPSELARNDSIFELDLSSPTADLSLWTAAPLQQAAWKLLARAAEALDRYQNSGRAKIKDLDRALQSLYQAESSRYFEHFAGPAASGEGVDETEAEFRSTLMSIYLLAGEPVPEELNRPVWELAASQSGLAPESSTSSAVQILPNGVSFEDSPDVLEPSWDLKRLTVEWDPAFIRFTIDLATAAAPSMTVDLYLDFNQRRGAGLTSLLPGRNAFMEPQDAWEYAVSADRQGGKIYKAGAQGQILTLQKSFPSVQWQNSRIVVSIPRGILRGSPQNWGYSCVLWDPVSGIQDSVILATEQGLSRDRLRALRIP